MNRATKIEAAPEAEASTSDLVDRGRTVIETEANALTALAYSLDEGFAEAVRLIHDSALRLVVTGMGKSGHVGRKITATFSATGTPAIFVHPAEAAHGDLGMLTSGDVVLVLSNSGHTAELRSIMAYSKSLGCKIIGVASRPDSPVMRGSDVRIPLPEMSEACPVNIAPTTSTTLMMALGDALAIAVMNLRGVSRERLQLLHPGGTIGLRLTPVNEIMHSGDGLPLVPENAPMRDVLVEMTEKSLGIAGVVDGDGRLVGAITDGDLRRHIDNLLDSVASDVMTPNPKTIMEGSCAGDAIALLSTSKITALFVVCQEQPDLPVGVVHIHDLSRLGVG